MLRLDKLGAKRQCGFAQSAFLDVASTIVKLTISFWPLSFGLKHYDIPFNELRLIYPLWNTSLYWHVSADLDYTHYVDAGTNAQVATALPP